MSSAGFDETHTSFFFFFLLSSLIPAEKALQAKFAAEKKALVNRIKNGGEQKVHSLFGFFRLKKKKKNNPLSR